MSKHVPALDGARGLAILLVIAFHARVVFAFTSEIPFLGFRLLGLGWSGVDLFFVLSGFLITGILIDNRESPDYFRTFYSRRVLRIFPLYFFYLFLILVVSRYLWLFHTGQDLWRSTNAWWYFTYLTNWNIGHPYDDRLLDHLWSLAIEEQFYLIWPAVILFVPRRRLKWLCGTIVAGAFVVRRSLGAAGWGSEDIYRFTACRLDCLSVGALVALGVRDFRSRLDEWARPLSAVCAGGFLAVVALSPDPLWSDELMRTMGACLLALLFGCLVFRAATAQTGLLHDVFASRFLRQCGKYSYGMYVFHSPVCRISAPFVRELGTGTIPYPLVLAVKYFYLPSLLLVSFVLAWLSWRFLEQPFLKLKRHVPYGSGSVLVTQETGSGALLPG